MILHSRNLNRGDAFAAAQNAASGLRNGFCHAGSRAALFWPDISKEAYTLALFTAALHPDLHTFRQLRAASLIAFVFRNLSRLYTAAGKTFS